MRNTAQTLFWACVVLFATASSGARAGGGEAAAILAEALGEEGLSALSAKGLVILHGKKGDLRLEHVQWQLLTPLAEASPAVLEFSHAFERAAASETAAGDSGASPALAVLSELSETGLMTGALHLLRQALAGMISEASALAASPKALTAPGDTLFETSWGREFAERTHADSLADPGPLIRPYFDSVFAGFRPQPQVGKHLLDYVLYAYATDLAPLLDSDVKKGSPSEELRAWLRKYFSDQRHLSALRAAKRKALSLGKRGDVARDLKYLMMTAKAILAKPGLLDAARKALSQAGPAPRYTLTMAGLHVHEPTRLGRHEMGDSVTVSGAYWIDGLAEKEKISIEETTFADAGDSGARHIRSMTQTRENGGPYLLTRTLTLKNSRSFIFRALIGGSGAKTLSGSIAVAVTDDFEMALRAAASAESSALDCNPKDAEAALARLETSLAEPARFKKQYAELLDLVKDSRRRAAGDAAAVTRLEESLDAIRADSSPQLCRYDLKRVDAAIKEARALPAGCDRYLSELEPLKRTIARRENDQDYAGRALEKAESLRRSCGFASAVESALNALAVLDADPAARCGPLAQSSLAAEKELAFIRMEEERLLQSDKDLKDAEENPDQETSLRRLRTLIAADLSQPTPDCHAKNLKTAFSQAKALSRSLPIPGDADVAALLPEDSSLASISHEVADAHRWIQAASDAAKARQSAEQEPLVPSAIPQTPPPAPPVPGPDARTKIKVRPPKEKKPQ